MKLKTDNQSAFMHNDYMYERVKDKKGKWHTEQVIQGPLIQKYIEIDDSDVESYYVYKFGKDGKIKSKTEHKIIPVEKAFSSVTDFSLREKYGVCSNSIKYLAAKFNKNKTHLLTGYGAHDDYDFEVYLPGGIVRSRIDSDFHAYRVREVALREKMAEIERRI